MAINTRDRRAAVIGLSLPVPSVLPEPDAMGVTDRPMLLWVYPGLTYGVVLARYIALTLSLRDLTLTLQSGRVQALNLSVRDITLTLWPRAITLTLSPRDITLTLKDRLYAKDY